MTDILASFKIYPEKRSRLFFRVRIFSSVRALRRYLGVSPLRRVLGRHGIAMCSTYTIEVVRRRRRLYVTPEMGEILIPISRLGSEVISHECTHAALGWAKRQGFSPGGDHRKRGGMLAAGPNEERFCYGLGRMVRQIVDRAYAKNLLPCVSPKPRT